MFGIIHKRHKYKYGDHKIIKLFTVLYNNVTAIDKTNLILVIFITIVYDLFFLLFSTSPFLFFLGTAATARPTILVHVHPGGVIVVIRFIRFLI